MGQVTLALATLALGAAACLGGRGERDAAGGDGSLTGVIAAVEPGPTATRVTVDPEPGAAGPGRMVLLVSSETEVELPGGRGGVADLAVGVRVRAWHAGAEMRSLPPQYHATHVRVLTGS